MGGRIRVFGALCAVTALYVLAGKLGLRLEHVNVNVPAVSPSAGIAVAALLVIGLRAWPAVAVGVFLISLSVSSTAVPSIAIAAGNTLAYVVAAVLAARVARGRLAFERGSDIVRFTALSGLLAPSISATVATPALLLSGLPAPADPAMVWFTVWLGDATGIVLFAPLCVLWANQPSPIRAGRVEAAALWVSLALVLYVVFRASTSAVRDMPLAMLMMPILLWSAFRFNARMTSTMSAVMSVIAVYRILHELGPFRLGEPLVSLLIGQSVVAIVSLLVLSVAAEVSARMRIEEELRQLNESLERRVLERTAELTRVYDRLTQAQAVAHVGSWEWDLVNDSVWWSDEMCGIFGVAQAPATYRDVMLLVHHDDREPTDAAVREALRTGQPFSFDQRIVRSDGEHRMVHARGRLEMDGAGRVVRMLGIGHDVTERHQAEEARAQLIREQMKLREAEIASSAKDAFMATLSHELRTPLNAALGWAHILRDSLHAEGRDDRAVQAIYRNLVLQSRLVSDILDISRIVKGELPLDRSTVDMASVFDTASDMVREAAAAKRIAVAMTTAGSTTLIGDARRLQQVAWNLLSNAVKFAPEGGRVTVSILQSPEGVECSVEDDGPGISPEFLPHIFEQFRQADSSVTRLHGGLGLGLAIAHEIVKGHHGTIEAGNRQVGGAVFVVRLPRSLAMRGVHTV